MRAYSPEQLAGALARVGVAITGRTIRTACETGAIPARKNRRGHWRIGERVVRLRWPVLFLAPARRAA